MAGIQSLEIASGKLSFILMKAPQFDEKAGVSNPESGAFGSARTGTPDGLSERGFDPMFEQSSPSRVPPDFSARIAVFPDFLNGPAFREAKEQAERLAKPERSYIPAHKKGGTIAYQTVIQEAPALVDLYQSGPARTVVSKLAEADVEPTPLRDQSSLSVLVYDRPGDHIGWHFDHNFYRGRHFTTLLTVVNEGRAPQNLSHAKLVAMLEGAAVDIETPPNTLVVFEGARVRHRVVPLQEGERRVVVSMTYCCDPRNTIWHEAGRRVKDISFFGLRALWA